MAARTSASPAADVQRGDAGVRRLERRRERIGIFGGERQAVESAGRRANAKRLGERREARAARAAPAAPKNRATGDRVFPPGPDRRRAASDDGRRAGPPRPRDGAKRGRSPQPPAKPGAARKLPSQSGSARTIRSSGEQDRPGGEGRRAAAARGRRQPMAEAI